MIVHVGELKFQPDVKETVGPAVEVIPEAMEVDHQEIIIKEDNAGKL